MNKEFKDYKETDVASSNSNFNYIDKDGRVHDRWNHNCNPTRDSWIGADGLSYWERVFDYINNEIVERKVFSCKVTDKDGITILTFFAQNHEQQDNYFLNTQRMLDKGFEQKCVVTEQEYSEESTYPVDLIPDNQPTIHEQAFPEKQEEGPSKSEKLRDEFRQAVKETTTKHPEKYDLYLRRYDKGISVDLLVQERYEKTGKLVSNQAESDVLTNIVRKAYKHMSGEKDLPKRRER